MLNYWSIPLNDKIAIYQKYKIIKDNAEISKGLNDDDEILKGHLKNAVLSIKTFKNILNILRHWWKISVLKFWMFPTIFISMNQATTLLL